MTLSNELQSIPHKIPYFPSFEDALKAAGKIGKTVLDIVEFEVNPLPHSFYDIPPRVSCYDGDELTSLKIYQVRKRRFPKICDNKFVSLFIHNPTNLQKILAHVSDKSNPEEHIGLTIFFIDKFLENRPEFNKRCCHTLVLLTAYFLACRYYKEQEGNADFLKNFREVNCSYSDFKKMVRGFDREIDLPFAEVPCGTIELKFKQAKEHAIFSKLVYKFPSLECQI